MEKHRPEDDLFKKTLENHPDFTPSKSDLNDMQNRLDAADNSNRKGGFGFWWLPFLLLPFIFAAGFLFYQNQKLDHQVQALNSKLLIIQKDTIQEKHITYHFDTIYNTTYIDRVVERESIRGFQNQAQPILNYLSNNPRAFIHQSPSDYFNFGNNNSTQKPFIHHGSNTFTTLQTYNSVKEKNQLKDTESNPESGLDPSLFSSQDAPFIFPLFSFIENDNNVNALLKNIYPASEFKKNRRNPMRHFTPKGVSIGIVGSPYSLTKVYSDSFKPTFSFGIESEIEFNKNVKLLLGIRSMNIDFEEKDPNLTALYPAIMPNDPTDKLRELYVSLNQIQVPIMIKYLFSNDKKWHPFFSFGIVANRPFRQKFKHKLISTSLEEYEILQNFKEGDFSIKNFEGDFGFEMNLTSKITGSASLYYLHDFELSTGEYFLWRNAGLNIGLKYKL
ncbi:MAG: outer membrane beta-barrel protein [Saprospiraceae bacterium]